MVVMVMLMLMYAGNAVAAAANYDNDKKYLF